MCAESKQLDTQANMYDSFFGSHSDSEKVTVSQQQQQHTDHMPSKSNSGTPACCPLCQEVCYEYSGIERHLMSTHNVPKDNVSRLLAALDPRWLKLASKEEGNESKAMDNNQICKDNGKLSSQGVTDDIPNDPSEAIESHLLQMVEEG